jgi:hypothetical protein
VTPWAKVARFRPDGAPDEAFGNAGEVEGELILRDRGGAVWLAAMAPDGAIVAARGARDSEPDPTALRVLRLRPNGRTDFDVRTRSREISLRAISAQDDGSLVLAGGRRVCLPLSRQPRGYVCGRDSTDSVFAVIKLRDPKLGAGPPPARRGGDARPHR